MHENSNYLIKVVVGEHAAGAGKALEATATAAAAAGLRPQVRPFGLEVSGQRTDVLDLIKDPSLNPEVSTLYVEDADPARGACSP